MTNLRWIHFYFTFNTNNNVSYIFSYSELCFVTINEIKIHFISLQIICRDAKGDYLPLVEMKSRGEWRQLIKYRRPVAFFHVWSPRQLLFRPQKRRTSQVYGGGAYRENHMDTTDLPYFPLGNITRETFSLFTSFTLRIVYICYSFSVWDQLVTSMYILEYKISLKQCIFVILLFQLFCSIRDLRCYYITNILIPVMCVCVWCGIHPGRI